LNGQIHDFQAKYPYPYSPCEIPNDLAIKQDINNIQIPKVEIPEDLARKADLEDLAKESTTIDIKRHN
jgi:hypothetical protein